MIPKGCGLSSMIIGFGTIFSKSSYWGTIINFIAGELDTCFLKSEIKEGAKSLTYTSTRLNVSLKEHNDISLLLDSPYSFLIP